MEKKPDHRPFDAATVGKVLAEVQEKADAPAQRRRGRGDARAIGPAGRRAAADDADRETQARALRFRRGQRGNLRKKVVPVYGARVGFKASGW